MSIFSFREVTSVMTSSRLSNCTADSMNKNRFIHNNDKNKVYLQYMRFFEAVL